MSILSQPNGPYDDEAKPDGLLRYAHRAGEPNGGDNWQVRRAHDLGVPILLRGIADGVFVPVLPAYVVGDDPVAGYSEIRSTMLRHGLQERHGARLHLPTRVADPPNRDALAERWEAFSRRGPGTTSVGRGCVWSAAASGRSACRSSSKRFSEPTRAVHAAPSRRRCRA